MDNNTCAVLVLLITLTLFNCTDKSNDGIRSYVNNDKPLYNDKEYVSIEKTTTIPLFSEEYEIPLVSEMTVDDNNFLYVLCQFESEITVFDDKGNFVRRMGQMGKGPQDLEKPHRLAYYNENLYILENFNSLKIWNTDGKYIDRKVISTSNYVLLHPFVNGTYLFSFYPSAKEYRYVLHKYNDSFEDKKELFSYSLMKPVTGKFIPKSVMALTRQGDFYFPESDDSFTVTKYNSEGEVQFSFDRPYNKAKYSEIARKYYQEQFGDRIAAVRHAALPAYPPVIRKMFLDSRENLWIVSGEINFDRGKIPIDAEVDIFDSKGTWLYNFSLKDIDTEAFIAHDRLYTLTPITRPGDLQFINVYEISYNY